LLLCPNSFLLALGGLLLGLLLCLHCLPVGFHLLWAHARWRGERVARRRASLRGRQLGQS
ncbi:MAG: hypothetical protein ACWGNB_08685, partial [Thiogranum sp.]